MSYEEYSLHTPCASWVEQDAEDWWRLTCRTARDAIRKADCCPKDIVALSISSQGITVVPVDVHGRALCAALTWLDVRAREQSDRIEQEFGDRAIFEHTGKHVDPAYTLPKILWLRENRPDIWSKTHKLLMPMDFLLARLSGEYVTDHSMASGTQLYDLKRSCWSNQMLKHYGISARMLPRICPSGTNIGKIQPEAAAALGLSENCDVVVGAQDQKCAALGVGLDDHCMTVSLGTAGAVTRLWHEALPEKYGAVGWCGYARPGAWVTEGTIDTAGTCLRWVRDVMYPGEGYDVINAEARMVCRKDNRLLFYPYLKASSGTDQTGFFYGVTLDCRRGDFALAVMEGVAFMIRSVLEQMQTDKTVRTLVLFGGGSRSPMWCQMIANVTGMRISVADTPEAASVGAAVLAGIGSGIFDGNRAPHAGYITDYIPERPAYYTQRYRMYRDLERRLWS